MLSGDQQSPGGGSRMLTRRRALAGGCAGMIGVAFAGFELISHGVLPGQHALDELDGTCSVSTPPETSVQPGPSLSGRFYSTARRREVGYTIAYPPGHRVGDPLPLALVLHGFGGDHTSGLGGQTLAKALARYTHGRLRAPIALAAADGGNGYWNPHPGDDPMGMLIHELLPLCRRQRLGRAAHTIGVIGISMGGYGALLLAEQHPQIITAVAAISPAVWTSYTQARAANPGAYPSAQAFANDDIVTHAARLAGTPTRIASGTSDPFHPGVQALIRNLPRGAAVTITDGCHDDTFFASQRSPSLDFIARHLAHN